MAAEIGDGENSDESGEITIPVTPGEEGYEDGFDYEYEEPEVYVWPENGIVTRIPFPAIDLSDLWMNNDFPDEQFFANASVPLSFFESYLDDCKGLGFVLDESASVYRDDSGVTILYSAYDLDDYRLTLNYHGDSDTGIMDVMLQSPRKFGTLQWPDSGPALLLPLPPTTAGSVGGMPQMFLIVYLGNMSRDLYRAYIEECKAAGFTENVSETDTTFSATDRDGIEFSASYEGAGTVAMQVLDPEQKWIARTQGILQENGDVDAQTEDTADGVPLPGGTEESDSVPPAEETVLPGNDNANESMGTADETNSTNTVSDTGESSSITKAEKSLPSDASGSEEQIQVPVPVDSAATALVDSQDTNLLNENSRAANSQNPNQNQSITRKAETSVKNAESKTIAGLTNKATARSPKEGNAEDVSESPTEPDRKAAWLIQPSALKNSTLQDRQTESRGASNSTGTAVISETDPQDSWPGSHSSRAVTLTGLLGICTILAGAISKRKAFARSLREDV